MSYTRLAGVNCGTTQLLLGHGLAGNRFHHGRTGQEHIAGLIDHYGKIGKRRGVHGSAGTRSHYNADLRDYAAGEDIALENLAVARQRIDALLNTGTAGIVEPDEGSTHFNGCVHYLAYLLGHGFAEGTSVNRKVLSINEYKPAIYSALSGYYTIAVGMRCIHSEVGAAVLDKHIEFFKTARVKQLGNTLARSELSFGVLRLDTFLTATESRTLPALDQGLDLIFLNTHKVLSIN